MATLLKGNCSHHATAIAKIAPKAKAKVSATVNRFANLFIPESTFTNGSEILPKPNFNGTLWQKPISFGSAGASPSQLKTCQSSVRVAMQNFSVVWRVGLLPDRNSVGAP
jgi:hypothetical protein